MTAAGSPVLARRRGGRLAVVTAVAGTVFIAAGAFWLSFTSLADLAGRSGIGAGQAWAWPLIVDGIIVVATVSAVALAGTRSAWYPWMLLFAGAVVSVTANSIHAVVAADADVPNVLAAAVAAVPPLVLLAITHLTVILTRPLPPATEPPPVEPSPIEESTSDRATEPTTVVAPDSSSPIPVGTDAPPPVLTADVDPADRRQVNLRESAVVLHDAGWSNRRVAEHLGVHKSTVGRWFPRDTTPAVPVNAPDEHDDAKEPTP